MSLEGEKIDFLFRNIPAIIETMDELRQKGIMQEDVVSILHSRANKGKKRSQSDYLSKEKIRVLIREIRKLELDVRGSIV